MVVSSPVSGSLAQPSEPSQLGCSQVLLYTCSGQLNRLLEPTQVPLLRGPKEVNWKQFLAFLQPARKAGEGG